MTSAASGDQQAMADLYDTYAGALYGYGYRRLGSTTLAEDLVQRVMTRLWQLADRYDPSRASVRTWVFTIAQTSCIDLHRAQPPPAATGDLPEAPRRPLRPELAMAAAEGAYLQPRRGGPVA